jgi:TadE-like protein
MGGRRPGRVRRAVAQATLEFAVVAPLFLLCLLGAIDAGLWAMQNSAEVSAVEQATRDAASAGGSALTETPPDARTVTADIAQRLQQVLFATRVVAWCGGRAGGAGCVDAGCPDSPATVQETFGPRVVAVCVQQELPPPCTAPPPGVTSPYPPYCDDSPMVSVRIVGYVAALVPPGFGFAAQGGELPTDIGASTHSLRFSP